ncbi:MAG: hypothetical protein EB060_01170 [Proteobacteria bacterium]|nr:hypothetical protein [Pseudomonadota bacterium]
MRETLAKHTVGAPDAALAYWLSIAESQICSLEVLTQLLPDVSKRLESDMMAISEQFVMLASTLQAQHALIQKMLESEASHTSLQTLHQQSQHSAQAIGKIIMGMQFQDWVTQNLVIATNVIKANIAHLEESMDKTATPQQQADIPIDKHFAKELVEDFKLGELQRRFVDHLLKHHYIKDTKEIDFSLSDVAEKKTADDNIDLF